MGRFCLVGYDGIPSRDCIHCGICRTRIAFIEDHVANSVSFNVGVFNKVFNVEVPDDVRYNQEKSGKTLADTYCVKCGMLLGWKVIAVPQPSMYIREGIFYMKWQELIHWNDEQGLNNQEGGANEQVPIEQHVGVNVQNADQDGGANEQVPNNQGGGANEQNVDQDEDANEQVPNEDVGQLAEGIDNIDLNLDL